MQNIAQQYANGYIQGWAGPELAREQFDILAARGAFREFKIERPGPRPTTGKKMFLHEVTRKVLGKDTENYRQEIGDCQEKDTQVLMANGLTKNVQDIIIGDEIINHLGQKAKVTDIVAKLYTGNMITIKLKGWKDTLTSTETHGALYMPKRLARFKFEGFAKKQVKDLEIGDYLLIPYGVQDNQKIILDIKDYIDVEYDDKHVWRKHTNKKINRFITVDENFARLIGLYLAEGGANAKSGHIQFSYHANETILHEETIALLNSLFNIQAKVYLHSPNCIVVKAFSVVLASFLKSIIPGNLYNKNIPQEFYLCNQNIKLNLLRGWLDGDGYISKKYNRLIGVSSSKRLISDIARLALSCKLNPRTLIRSKANHQRVPACQIDFYGKDTFTLYEQEQIKTQLRLTKLDKTPYGFARKIEKLDVKYVENHPVYCITTEGEFTAIFNGIAAQNCVSFGMKNAIEYLQCVEILLKGDAEKFQNIFPPYIYGISRVQIGGGRLGNSDGSLGSWAADGVKQYGILSSIDQGVPQYAGSVAKKWGARPGPPTEFIEISKKHLVRTVAPITSVDALCEAICNGYACTVASMQGFAEQPDSKGFHRASGQWAHQMCIIGIDMEWSEPYVLILNSWGDVHGRLKCFHTGVDLPAGVLRARISEIERSMINGRDAEVFAPSQYDGYPENRLDKALFRII